MAEFKIECNLPDWAVGVQADVRLREEGGLFPAGPPMKGAVGPVGTFPFASPPVNIIHADQELYIDFSCRCEGFLPQFFGLPGHWHLTVMFEKMGPGESPANRTAVVPGPMTPGNWTHTITIPSGILAPLAPAPETGQNAYRVVVTMIYHNPANTATIVAGFADLGLLQVYQD